MGYTLMLTISGIGIFLGFSQVTDPRMKGYGKWVAFVAQILIFSFALSGIINNI